MPWIAGVHRATAQKWMPEPVVVTPPDDPDDPPAPADEGLKSWNGTQWVTVTTKVWDGTQWVAH